MTKYQVIQIKKGVEKVVGSYDSFIEADTQVTQLVRVAIQYRVFDTRWTVREA